MSDTLAGTARTDARIPANPSCRDCGSALSEPFGWCAGCRASLCLACGREHFCQPSCRTNGCTKGLCVRLVVEGRLSEDWGLPGEAELRR